MVKTATVHIGPTDKIVFDWLFVCFFRHGNTQKRMKERKGKDFFESKERKLGLSWEKTSLNRSHYNSLLLGSCNKKVWRDKCPVTATGLDLKKNQGIKGVSPSPSTWELKGAVQQTR